MFESREEFETAAGEFRTGGGGEFETGDDFGTLHTRFLDEGATRRESTVMVMNTNTERYNNNGERDNEERYNDYNGEAADSILLADSASALASGSSEVLYTEHTSAAKIAADEARYNEPTLIDPREFRGDHHDRDHFNRDHFNRDHHNRDHRDRDRDGRSADASASMISDYTHSECTIGSESISSAGDSFMYTGDGFRAYGDASIMTDRTELLDEEQLKRCNFTVSLPSISMDSVDKNIPLLKLKPSGGNIRV